MGNKAGFTLIELLLVLAIIGIISAIAIPALLGQRARAKDKTCIAAVTGTIGDMVNAYDKAKEKGAATSECLSAMRGVLVAANARGEKNPWATTPAFAELVGPSGMPAIKGEATFYVDNIASPTMVIGKVLLQHINATTNTTRFEKRVALD